MLDEEAEEYDFGLEFGPENIYDDEEEQEIVPAEE